LNQARDNPPTFDAEVRLGEHHKLPPSAAVFVEAYRGSSASWMRFPFGTVGTLKPPADRRLTDFDGADGILFRLRVTSSDKQGLLLAEVDQVTPRAPGEEERSRLSILPVRSDKNLEKRIWRLDFEDGPVLLVNSVLGEKWDVVRDQVFMALVMPEILESILVRILLVERYREDEDDDDDETRDWRSQWMKFVRSIPGTIEKPDSEEAVVEWIDQVVIAFSRQQNVLDRYETYFNRSDK
jgi:hypothetical protein